MARSLMSPSAIFLNLSNQQFLRKIPIEAHLSSNNLHLSQRKLKLLSSESPKICRKNSGFLLCKATHTYNVEIEHEGEKHTLQVADDETILSKALDAGINVPHDCKLGVCMTCPARLLSGEVEQSEGMLSDDVIDKGYALMCSSYPRSDCSIRTIPEDELLSLQLATASD